MYSSSYDRYTDPYDDSTTHKLKNAYWTTKQVVIKKLGRKEDEHVVASDSELDAKLELFRSVERTSSEMTRILERYQDKICMLSQAENELGRFLKNNGGDDKTRAGKMMVAVGKSLSFSAQQRLALRVPLSRLHQEVETFRYRAIADTFQTVSKMEQKRTEYRAALLWMKDVSENLDPDTYKQMDKFRKVQKQVRVSKSKFDKIKLDSMQKVDLLAASRCNMFSHVLSLYQTTLLQFWEKTCKTMVAVADSFRGYQYYEFSMLKDLTDESKKLARLTRNKDKEDDQQRLEKEDMMLLTVEESRINNTNDNRSLSKTEDVKSSDKDEAALKEAEDFEKLNKRLEEIFTGGEFKDDPGNEIKAAIESNKLSNSKKKQDSSLLDDFGLDDDAGETDQNDKKLLEELLGDKGDSDLFFGTPAMDNSSSNAINDVTGSIFDELLAGPGASSENVNRDWNSLFQSSGSNSQKQSNTPANSMQSLAGVMPSNLLDMSPGALPASSSGGSAITAGDNNSTKSAAAAATSRSNKEAAAWISMFADLDPLGNPDSISKNEGQITDT